MSGAGAAFSEKAMRRPEVELSRGPIEIPFSALVHQRLKSNLTTFLHEVSQGYALSVNHGSHYPHCTFRDCTPQQAYSDFQLTPAMVGDVYLNVRSFPIRVGNNYREGKQTGYSGDWYPDQRELTWQEVGVLAEMPTEVVTELAEKERTTVTRKVRRVATQSWQLCREAAQFSGATKLVLNFPQYLHWSAHNLRGGREQLSKLHPRVRSYMDQLEAACNLPISMIGTGAHHDSYIFLE
jgi:adenylosuccinate synthase